ncbi:hypothetical protein EfsSVR2332_22500 [Enterococcus faecalis]|uniref:Uncharacterized protein n=1 Tax=Enterococcus faecalis TaxID=1351 RepID=A0AC59HRC2_ENTFL|nr:hypothetical protein EfsSVR2332_22500 [Enterococcus faecalis]
MFTSGLGGAILAIFHIQSNSYGLAVIPSFLMYIYSAHQLVIYLLVALLSVGVCYALTSLFAIPQEVLISDKVIEEEEREVFEMQHNTLDEQLFSPVTGYAMNLTAVNDPVFSSEMMGKGLAIMPTANKVYAPADGLLNLVAETGHAYGIQTDAGAEVLIHIGIDTVTLGQEVFQTQVTQGHRVKKGDLLGTFDRKAIKEAGLDSTERCRIYYNSAKFYSEMKDYQKSVILSEKGIQICRDKHSIYLLDYLLYEKAFNKQMLGEDTADDYRQAYYFTQFFGNTEVLQYIEKDMKAFNISY